MSFIYSPLGVEAIFRLADTLQGVAAAVLVRVPAYGASEREIATAKRLAAIDTLGADSSSDHEDSQEVEELHLENLLGN